MWLITQHHGLNFVDNFEIMPSRLFIDHLLLDSAAVVIDVNNLTAVYI
jgi:hypothetical protein